MKGSDKSSVWLVGLLSVAALWAGSNSSRQVSLIWPSGSLPAEVSTLEAQLGKDRTDMGAALRLGDTLLDHGQAGQAEASLSWVAPELQAEPRVASLRVRALTQLGQFERALKLQRAVLASCTDTGCAPTVFARGKAQERLLEEFMRVGVTDPEAQPARVALAQFRATRTGRLED
ncbi:MAG: hypothetical protein H6718_22230 [Polyangiaceae bacterium]|nr:hypothetical protein [Myxococcales bacterium]MCB9588142.1 hypothetical protein [Polyangiaceae bacterium]